MVWTAERVERLKSLCESGLSASAIARNLGADISRNAVIGKVHRMHLTLLGTPSSTAARRLTEGIARRKKARRSVALQRREPKIKSQPMPPDPPIAGAPAPLMLKIADLTASSCRWPIGDPQHADFGFCGHAKQDGLPYCEDHARKAYSPAVSRVAVKRAA